MGRVELWVAVRTARWKWRVSVQTGLSGREDSRSWVSSTLGLGLVVEDRFVE